MQEAQNGIPKDDFFVSPFSGNALSYSAFPLEKQSTGLFFNSPFAERLNALQGSALHPPEALPLDSAKGITSLWNPIIGFFIIKKVPDIIRDWSLMLFSS